LISSFDGQLAAELIDLEPKHRLGFAPNLFEKPGVLLPALFLPMPAKVVAQLLELNECLAGERAAPDGVEKVDIAA
jgi:hypothetical protein